MELSTRYHSLYRRLLVISTIERLPGESVSVEQRLSNEELASLMSVASILALSDITTEQTQAYEIAARIVSLQWELPINLLKASEFILTRLGNFPGRQLLRERYGNLLHSTDEFSPYLYFESITREIQNTILDAAGKPRPLTDFQFDTLQAFAEAKSVSISAPTSAGKSFILSLEVIRKLREGGQPCIVYLVPTRALIRQVVLTLREDLRNANLAYIPVRSIPTPVKKTSVQEGIIYVLTQERLLSLIHSTGEDVWITTLIVDEAQGISDGARGILLHAAIEEVVSLFPQADIFFASPLASNPQYLLDLFQLHNGKPTLEQLSPVAQNLIFVEPIRTNANMASFKLLIDGEFINLAERNLGFSLRNSGVLKRRAMLAAQVVDESGCGIVYVNGARDAEKVAEELLKEIPPITELDSQITEFISFLEQYIHPEYGLINVLKSGVAFHYSNMPGSVRAGVEDLCRANKLRFICCTSTLLQGINLPARDVIIENPKRGMGKPMRRSDFVNLAGRAGRLLKEFHGNVWCMCPNLWEEPSYIGKPLQEIESAFHKCLSDGGLLVRQVLEDNVPMEEKDRETAIAALNRIYSKYILPGDSHLLSEYQTIENEQSLNETVEKLKEIETTLPQSIFTRNYGILPSRLQTLYEFFLKQEDPREFIPISPFMAGTNARMLEC